MTVLAVGLCTLDLVQRVTELPRPAEKVQSLDVAVAAGGPATGAAVTVAALGGTVRLVTVLGGHPLAALVRADLRACGVELLDADPRSAAPPPLSAATVRDRDGERTVVARNAPPRGPVSGTPWPAGDRDDPAVVLLDGHHPDLALGAARRAHDRGIPVVLDAGSWKPVLDELLPLVDVAACSAQFDLPAAELLDRGVPTVVRTGGPGPVRWWRRGRSGEVPVPVVRARDTLGAGDVWHGAFAHALATRPHAELPELLGFASVVASERVRHTGPRSWLGAVERLTTSWSRQSTQGSTG